MATAFRSLPSVNQVLDDARVQALIDDYSRRAVLELVQDELSRVRAVIKSGGQAPTFDDLVWAIEERAESRWRQWPRPVINATGVILHTNLGRAPLSRSATEAARRAAAGYSDLELNLDNGGRGSRQAHITQLLRQVTGAQAAFVVNNNASAVLLGLAAIASGKEVIVSRGEAVEIGGGFRIPDVLRQSGATLVEVGTTNRTYVRDFEDAITEKTGAILSVHASNFRVVGFVHSPDTEALVALGEKRGIPVLHDLGSGCLLDTTRFGLAPEPMPQDSVAAGVGLAFFSGDKLLGGPQAGIIIGKQGLVDMVSRHPLARAVRMDKLSMAALAATLMHYVKEEALQEIPVWRMVSTPAEELKSRALRLRKALGPRTSVVQSLSAIGGGSLPGETLPSWALSIGAEGMTGGAESLARRLRQGDPPVIGRIEDERVLIDLRTVLPEQTDSLRDVLRQTIAESELTS